MWHCHNLTHRGGHDVVIDSEPLHDRDHLVTEVDTAVDEEQRLRGSLAGHHNRVATVATSAVLAWPLPPLWGWERHLSLSPRPDAGLGPARTVVGVAVGVAVEVMPPLMRVAGAGTPGLHLGEKLCVHSPSRNKSLGSNGLENYPTGFTGCGWGRLVTCSTTAQGATPQKETHNDQLHGSPPKRHC